MLEYNRIYFIGLPVITLILLLPGFHFWTSAIGKDSLFFMLLMMFFYGIQALNKRFILSIISLGLLVLIRPHMSFIILFSISVALFIRSPKKYNFAHLIVGVFTVILLIAFIPYIASFVSVENLEMDAINERLEFYTEYGANKTDDLSSYVDVTSYSLPLKMVTYLFRPLFFDARSILQLLASFENLFLLIIILKWLKSINFKLVSWYKYIKESDKIMFVYLLVGWVVLSATMYNLGLASRQKYMLLPILFVLMFRDLGYRKRRTNEKEN